MKTNMFPKKGLFQQGIHLLTIDFQGMLVSFQGSTIRGNFEEDSLTKRPFGSRPRLRGWKRKQIPKAPNLQNKKQKFPDLALLEKNGLPIVPHKKKSVGNCSKR